MNDQPETMDQLKLIQVITDCIDKHHVLNIQKSQLDGIVDNICFEPFLLGFTPTNQWTFIYGKLSGQKHFSTIPVPFIISAKDTGATFSSDPKLNPFIIFDFERISIIQNINELQIIDLTEPEEEEEEEDDDPIGRHKCPFCKMTTECKHLLFEFDLSYEEIAFSQEETFEKLINVLQRILINLLNDNKTVGFIHYDPDIELLYDFISDLMEEAESTYNRLDQTLDYPLSAFIKLLDSLYCAGEEFVSFYRYGSGGDRPGSDSAMIACFVADPEEFVNIVEANLLDIFQQLEMDTDDPGEYLKRGITRFNQHDYYEAIIDFSKVLYLDKKCAEAYYYRGLCRNPTFDKTSAISDFKRAVFFDPGNEQYIKCLESNK